MIVALFALLWLFVLRPQRRRSTEQLQMQDTLRVGDEVITAGGIRGFVRQLDEEVLKVEIAPEVVVRLDRRAVAALRSAADPCQVSVPGPALRSSDPLVQRQVLI